jgi:hypothetical protein
MLEVATPNSVSVDMRKLCGAQAADLPLGGDGDMILNLRPTLSFPCGRRFHHTPLAIIVE